MPSDPERQPPSPTVEIPEVVQNEKADASDGDIVVDWEGPNDPLSPKNWSRQKKWAATLVVSSFTLISPVSSSMIAPASPQVAAHFGITNDVVIGLITSIFFLAYAIGPLAHYRKDSTQNAVFLTSMPLMYMFQGTYGESIGASGINYLAFGVGVTGASQVNAQFMDWIFRRLKERNGGEGRPEYRIPSMVPGTIALLLMTGWAVQAKVHWIVPDIGVALIGAGIILNFQSIQIYVVDAFALYAASALASVGCFRSLFRFAFPLFAEQIYRKLGYGKGDTILAVIAVVIGCPSPWLLWTYGRQLRMRSKFAKRPT